jgi:dTDP-glucose 4,6-dehydratase
MNKGINGEIYNIGGKNERNNLEITELILKGLNKSEDLVTYVKDRPGHDRRYSLDCRKLSQLGWNPKYSFDEAMSLTIEWYKNNREWWDKIKSGQYLEYYKKHYKIED